MRSGGASDVMQLPNGIMTAIANAEVEPNSGTSAKHIREDHRESACKDCTFLNAYLIYDRTNNELTENSGTAYNCHNRCVVHPVFGQKSPELV